MAHPYFRKKPFRKRSNLVWVLGCFLIAIVLAVPWFLPSGIASGEPYSTIKNITTFPFEYDWHHSYIYEPDPSLAPPVENDDFTDENIPSITSSYFPLAVGNKWTYKHTKKGGMMNSESETVTYKTIEITEKKTVRDYDLYAFKSTEGDQVTTGFYYWDEEGLKFTRDDIRPQRHSLLILQNNPAIGDTWTETPGSDVTNSVEANEDFATQAGNFSCILVHTQYSKSPDRSYLTWYSNGVGIISQRHGSASRGLDEWHLTEFDLK